MKSDTAADHAGANHYDICCGSFFRHRFKFRPEWLFREGAVR
jgi:hypothetical protein